MCLIQLREAGTNGGGEPRPVLAVEPSHFDYLLSIGRGLSVAVTRETHEQNRVAWSTMRWRFDSGYFRELSWVNRHADLLTHLPRGGLGECLPPFRHAARQEVRVATVWSYRQQRAVTPAQPCGGSYATCHQTSDSTRSALVSTTVHGSIGAPIPVVKISPVILRLIAGVQRPGLLNRTVNGVLASRRSPAEPDGRAQTSPRSAERAPCAPPRQRGPATRR